jgi:teichuronic acid biosynthesis glycosyltransferase TuaG
MYKQESLISVVIALYNSDKYIHKTITSVLSQTYTNIELIIVDDASTDDSVSVVNEFIKADSRVNLISLNENSGGPAKPRNIGIDNAKGDFVAFLDSDDLWKKNKLDFQIKKIKSNDIMAFTSIDIINENGVIENRFFHKVRPMLQGFFSNKGLMGVLFYNPIPLSSVLIRSKILNKLRFDESKDLHAVEDYCMWLKLYERYPGRILFIKTSLVEYRVHDNNISSNYARQCIKIMHGVSKFYLSIEKYEYLIVFIFGMMIRFIKIFFVNKK